MFGFLMVVVVVGGGGGFFYDDDGVCWECKREEDMSERLEEWEKQQHLRM